MEALAGNIHQILCKKGGVLAISYDYIKIDIAENVMLYPHPEIYFPHKEKKPNTSKTDKDGQQIQRKQNLDFLKSGSIYRGVTLGSESGVSLQSGLNLELKGKISDDISIKGALSDQNIPIQPEGNTQTINEIDKVYIQLGMQHENITFGDYNLAMGRGDYGQYNRKLQGIYGESQRGITHTKLGGAVAKGQYTSNNFNGEEGNQGPYQLTGKEGETAIVVLAGTEKLWIDGVALTRGENHDYVIDYSTGEITFTAKQLITSDSRITADFQYSDLIYQQNIWYAESEVGLWNKKMKIAAEFIKETDDKDNPIELEFSDDDIALLKSIGDDSDLGFQSTVNEDTNGVYLLQDSILVYVGEDAGTHSAVFYNIGTSGQYRKKYTSSSFYFEWVDKDDPDVSDTYKEEALYLPAKPIKLPTDHKLYHISAEFTPSKKISISTEYAQSDLDLNSFSTHDDNDNIGHAYKLAFTWKALESRRGNFSLTTTYNNESETFNPIDRSHEIEYARKWDLDSDSTQGSQSFETTLEYKLKNNVVMNFSGASFKQNEFNSNRYKISGQFSYKRLKSSEFYEEKIISLTNREWLRRKGSVEFNVWRLTPYSTLYYEKKNNSTSYSSDFSFLEQTYGIRSESSKKVQWSVEQNFRDDDSKDSIGWIDYSQSKNLKLSTQINDWKTLSTKFTFANRQKTYAKTLTLDDVNFSIFNLELRQSPKEFPISWDASMEVEKERSTKKEKLYYYVGEGEGQYRYDSTYAEYVPYANGSYLLRIISSSIKIPVTSIENALRIRYSGSRLKNPILKNISFNSQINLQQEIKDQNNVLSQWSWKPANNDTSQSFFFRSINNQLNYRIPDKKINLSLKYRTSIRKSQLDVRGAENTYINEYSSEYRGPLINEIKLKWELSAKQTKRKCFYNSSRDRDILAITSESKFSWVYNRKHHFDFILTLSKDRKDETTTDIEAFLTGLRLEYEIKILKQGRWKIFGEFDNVRVSPEDSVIPYEMCQGNQVGNTVAIGASSEYRIGKYLSIRGNYESRSEPSLGLYHRGTVEVRAMF